MSVLEFFLGLVVGLASWLAVFLLGLKLCIWLVGKEGRGGSGPPSPSLRPGAGAHRIQQAETGKDG
jgi:hypothetical protein